MKRLVVLLPILVALATGFAQTPNVTPAVRYVTRAEYFFDADPGVGNGISITNFTAADTVRFSANISTSKLPPGFHILQMRVCDTSGIWGLAEKRFLYIESDTTANTANIIAAEYFIDTDPGPGKGIPVSVGTPGAVVNFPALIPTNLSPGFHLVGIRSMDANGKWGFSETRNFYLTPPAQANLPQITGAEYFYDTDPGVGNGTGLTLTAGDIITQPFMIPVPPAMSAGDHFLAIRVKDQAGHWSLFERDTLTVGGTAASVTCPHDTTVMALAGQCTAIVNNIDPIVSPSGSVFTYTLSGATTGSGTGTASGQIFNAGTTTVTYALSSSPSTNCSFTVTVNTNVVPSVSISATSTTICSGQSVTFTATPVNGGTPAYQWKVNGNNIGSNSATYQSSSLLNNDIVTVQMISSIGCANPQTVTSNADTIHVTASVTPSVSISTPSTTICSGQSATFTATPVNGGTPTYQWKLNGNNVGSNSATYQNSSWSNNDIVNVQMTSSISCANPQTVTSDTDTMHVSSSVTPSVTITTESTTICSGQLVTFTAAPVNGGNSPVYEWTLNNNAVGTDTNIYQTSNLQNGDVVRVTMSSSLGCASPQVVYSNSLTMNVGTAATPSVSIATGSTSVCSGASVTFTVTSTNGGDNPTYQWKLNGSNVGTNSASFQSSSLANGDIVKVDMTSSLGCANPTTVTSNTDTMHITSSVIPSVTIDATATTICAGTPVTFTAMPTNGGDAHYEWVLNGNEVGTNSATYQDSTLNNGDSIAVYMTSSLTCANPKTVKASVIAMNVAPLSTYYADVDGDGYGNRASTVHACSTPSGYVTDSTDCDDTNATVHPGAVEICGNGIDDNCNGLVDENCDTTLTLPVLTVRTYPVKEGNIGLTILNMEVMLDKPATLPVSIDWATSDDDATSGLDYVAASGTLFIPVGSSSGSIQVKIIGDLTKESNERFYIVFSNPVNVVLPTDPRSRIMIIDDDKGKINTTLLTIPSVARRNQVWTIPQIGMYQNDVMLMDVQGQVVSRFVNYQNNRPIGNVAVGLYFYRIRTVDGQGQVQHYSGRLMITE